MTMDHLQLELAKLRRDANLKQSMDDVDKIIEQLERARETIIAEPDSASITLAKLQNPVQQDFRKVIEDLKKIHKGHNSYGKALDKYFPAKALPTEYDALASHPSLINRAIAMHLLREGQFDVASTFLSEALDNPPQPHATPGTPNPASNDSNDLASLKSQELQEKFSNMYQILHDLKNQNLHPAIEWARQNSAELENRGSNLEFELCKLQYIWLFQGAEINGLPDDEHNGLNGAIKYAQETFPRHQIRFTKDCQQLLAAILYRSNLRSSPYWHLFNTETAWSEVSQSFTREFCSLLGLSPSSPLYIACTAGAIALPTLLKLASIVKEKRTEWTTQDELPVEIALPRSMIFHAIFVCPVSKEQTTESNPPMMMPCGHVVAKESLQRLSKGSRFKCPYCPNESLMRDARQVVL
ncbi:CTLH/CRA C-terminal to lish motif domain-containing protein [Rhexocercosporidium sp. MPI-PUGE-AT-0058]|nr:CTLH/CRA C-terminal to lish motif domain-containing protein [Rhexocercosporidium sp. MPI-PUGE-AT-0058]